MKKVLTCIVLLCIISGVQGVYAQKFAGKKVITVTNQSQTNNTASLWTAVSQKNAPPKSLLRMPPAEYLVYSMDVAQMKSKLWSLGGEKKIVISLPMPDGTYRDFRVWEASMMPDALAAQFPDIKTFSAEAVNDSRVTAKLDFTLFGFHAVVFDGDNVAFIDPYDNYGDGFYVIHYKSNENRPSSQTMKCAVGGDDQNSPAGQPMELYKSGLPATDLSEIRMPPAHGVQDAYGKTKEEVSVMSEFTTNGSSIRTYRLALSANHFYCQAATGLSSPTIGQCFSAMTTTMNRVNGVFNRELSVQMNFVAGESLIIWPTAAGDPFDAINSDATMCINQNQTTCDATILSANYDVGHVFTTGAGGLAAVGIICNNSQKARGVTGSSFPVGDAFDIDYVCHELGHEFGSSHTFNNNVDGSCGSNASAAHAYEPASGTTIMDYAGICDHDNSLLHSDPYFSANSLEQIYSIISGSGSLCAVITPGNIPAAFSATFSATYNIPYKTPFELSCPAVTSSPLDTAITYSWYQRNLGDFGRRLNQTSIYGPLFRSFQPVYTTTRVFPRIDSVLKDALFSGGVLMYGGAPHAGHGGERAPDTARFLTFKMAVRNISAGYGCFTLSDDSMHLNVSSTGAANGYAGFRVTSQNTGGIIYTGGSTQTVTWNVVGTNNPPVNAANVDIYMSTDGGFTWPYTIGTFPNTGTASVSIPNPAVTSTTCRIKVKGNNNVFFNINSTNFRVNPGPTTAPIAGTFTVCVGANTALTDATPGGTWSSGNTAVATVNVATGVVAGISGGTSIITYHAGTGNVTATVTVTPLPVAGTITGGTGVCIGLTTALADAASGGVWSSSNTAQATISTAGVVTGIAAGTTLISYTVSNACGSATATRALTVSAPTAVAGITGTMAYCAGTSGPLFNATPGGVWSSVNTVVATIDAFGQVSALSAGTSTISYSVTNGSGCTSASTAIVTVNTVPVATTTPTGAVVICTGGSQLLTASPVTAGLTYQWQDAGIDIPGATTSTYNATAAGTFRVVITNASTCSGTSAVVTITESGTTVTPSVSLAATPGTTICSAVGTVTFTATPVNGGASPVYQWFVNDVLVLGSAATFAYPPGNGDEVKCLLTSSLACAAPSVVRDSVIMTVGTSVTPAVFVSPAPNDTVCIGQTATYSATPVNGGTAPSYQWSVNGFNVATGPTYTTTPANGDIVFCTMISNAVCRTTTAVTSAPLVMTVQAPATNSVNISASSSSIVAGESVTFVAIALNAGSSATFEWFIDGVAVPGATNVTFTTSAITNGQIVHCKVTSSLPCVLPHIALSGGFTMIVTSGLQEVGASGNAFALSPNPNHGSFAVSGKLLTADTQVGIVVTNVLGQVIEKVTAPVVNGHVYDLVNLPVGVAKGVYMITIRTEADQVTFRMVID